MDGEGNYAISSLPIGFYRPAAESKGFKLAEVANIVLQIAQRARIDLTLVPGDLTQAYPDRFQQFDSIICCWAQNVPSELYCLG